MSAGHGFAKPARLTPGCRVALVAPASPFPREELLAGVQELVTLGFAPVYDERVLARERFVAGDAPTRAALLHDAWRDPSIAAIIAIRGGYGSAQLLPLLDTALLRAARKIFIGYSDITALLTLHLQHRLVAFHGPMIDRRLSAGVTGYDRHTLLAATGEATALGALSPPGCEALRQGEARGVLTGGTLTQLVASLGTPWAYAPPSNCILFLEDVAERPYRVHRMLTQLAQAGVLQRARAIVCGEFPSCDEAGEHHVVREVLREFFAEFPGPVLFNFPSGHTAGPTWTLPFGVQACVRSTPATLVIEEAAVA